MTGARTTLALLVALIVVVGGCGGSRGEHDRLAGQAVEVAPANTTTSTAPTPGEPSTGPPSRAQVADPIRVRVPAIGVDAAMMPLELRDDGRIEVPTEFDQAGWWVDGPEPGETGPAVILGHVDSRDGPAVFFDLSRLEAGDLIHVDRRDGTTVTYVVQRTEQHPKNAFPTEAVYGPTPDPVLRLVTCGGTFDRERRSYYDNIVVFAELADAPR